jgi:hypothetical protein
LGILRRRVSHVEGDETNWIVTDHFQVTTIDTRGISRIKDWAKPLLRYLGQPLWRKTTLLSKLTVSVASSRSASVEAPDWCAWSRSSCLEKEPSSERLIIEKSPAIL